MSRHRLEVADVIRQHGGELLRRWGRWLSSRQRKALHDIGSCRSAALGAHIEKCDSCPRERIAYNSCSNRHCPKCQSAARDRWLQARAEELLPVRYCHVVFTVPQALLAMALQNQQFFYGLLFDAASESLQQLARDPKRLGAEIGFFAVLHTWNQKLLPHPHLHCVVPAGGIAVDGSRWIECPKKFFLPVRPLSLLFRGKLLDALRRAYERGELGLEGRLAPLRKPKRFYPWLRELRGKDWVVFVKPPMAGPEQVLRYLARYTHRVAISNGRLRSLQHGRLRFRFRNSNNNNRIETMALDAVEFLRRFLLHVLPRGFIKIRYYGFLSHRKRAAGLARCRELLPLSPTAEASCAALSDLQRRAVERRCPHCREGRLRIVQWLSALELERRARGFALPETIDSS
jgi:hypothetical protein